MSKSRSLWTAPPAPSAQPKEYSNTRTVVVLESDLPRVVVEILEPTFIHGEPVNPGEKWELYEADAEMLLCAPFVGRLPGYTAKARLIERIEPATRSGRKSRRLEDLPANAPRSVKL